MKYYVKHKIKGAYEEQTDSVDLENATSLNQTIFTSFERYAKQCRPCLFFYAENDSATWEFKKYFLVNLLKDSLKFQKYMSFIYKCICCTSENI